MAGRLTLDEFAERTDAVYSAETWSELGALTADLPEGSALARRAVTRCSYHQALEVYYEPKRQFGQVWGTVVIWLVIAAVAHVFAAIPLVVLSAFVLVLTNRRERRRHRRDGQMGEPHGS